MWAHQLHLVRTRRCQRGPLAQARSLQSRPPPRPSWCGSAARSRRLFCDRDALTTPYGNNILNCARREAPRAWRPKTMPTSLPWVFGFLKSLSMGTRGLVSFWPGWCFWTVMKRQFLGNGRQSAPAQATPTSPHSAPPLSPPQPAPTPFHCIPRQATPPSPAHPTTPPSLSRVFCSIVGRSFGFRFSFCHGWVLLRGVRLWGAGPTD